MFKDVANGRACGHGGEVNCINAGARQMQQLQVGRCRHVFWPLH